MIEFAIWLAALIMVAMFMLAGFKLITAQGDVGKRTEAQSGMRKAVVGFVVVLFAWLMVNTVMTSLLRSDLVGDDVVNLLEQQ